MAVSGNLFVISAPSGAGKTSLIRELIQANNKRKLSVSHTTRSPRDSETHGQSYFFISQDEFKEREQKNEFVESAEVFGNFYGTSRHYIEEQLQQGFDVFLDIDWQGAQQIKKQMPQAVMIYVLPPSQQALLERLQGRGQDSDDVIKLRMNKAISELSHHHKYEFIVVNDDFQQAFQDLETIIHSYHLKNAYQLEKQEDLIKNLLEA